MLQKKKKCLYIHKIIKSSKNIRYTEHSKYEYGRKESESEDKNDSKVEYANEDIENDYNIENYDANKSNTRKELKNIIREVLSEYQAENI